MIAGRGVETPGWAFDLASAIVALAQSGRYTGV
jgi:hypothetical protein